MRQPTPSLRVFALGLLATAGACSGSALVSADSGARSGQDAAGAGVAGAGAAGSNDAGSGAAGSGAAGSTDAGGSADGAADAGVAGGGGGSALGCVAPPVVAGHLATSWVATLGDGQLNRVIVAPSGDIVAGGTFVEGLHIAGVTYAPNAGSFNNPFLAAFDPAGHVRWERTFATNWTVASVGADAAGNLYVTGDVGQFAPRADLGLGPIADGAFVAKLDATGKTLWTRGASALVPAGANAGLGALAVSAAGDLAVIGGYSTDTGGEGAFLVLYDSAGDVRWSKPVADSFGPGGVAFDGAGNVVLGGTFSSRLVLGAVPQTTTEERGFVATLDATGQLISLRLLGAGTEVSAIATDGVRVIAGGRFGGALGLGASTAQAVGFDDLFVATIDAPSGPGSAPRVTTFPSSDASLTALASDGQGGVLVLADARGAMGLGTSFAPPNSVVLADVAASGAIAASAAFGVPDEGQFQSLALDGAGGVVVVGAFKQLGDLGTGPLAGAPPSSFSQTMFVSRYALTPGSSMPSWAPCPSTVSGALLSWPFSIGRASRLLVRGDTLLIWGDDAIWSMPLAGGAPKLLALAQRDITSLDADDTSIVWTTWGAAPGSNETGLGQVLAMPRAGGAAAVLADHEQSPRAVVLDGARVLWAAGGGARDVSGQVTLVADGQVRSAPRAGGAVSVVASGLSQPGPIALCGGGNLAVAEVTSLATRGERAPVRLDLLAPNAPAPTAITTGDGAATALACDAAAVYWLGASSSGIDASFPDGTLERAPLAGGAATIVKSGLANPYGLTLVGDQLLWAEAGTSVNTTSAGNAGISSMAKAGGAVTAVVEHASSVSAFSADAAHVAYMISRGSTAAIEVRAR